MTEPRVPLLRPFTGFLATPPTASRVMGMPSPSLDSAHRKAERNDPLSYRFHLGRRGDRSANEARDWIQGRTDEGIFQRVGPSAIVYRRRIGDKTSVGVIVDVSLSAYRQGHIKKHENTLERSESRMVRYMAQTRVFGKPVTLTYRSSDQPSPLASYRHREPEIRLHGVEGSVHDLWILDRRVSQDLCSGFTDDLYITDGHHRLAAAATLAAAEGRTGYLPAGIFAPDELLLGAFARCITMPDLDTEALLTAVKSDLRVNYVDPADCWPTRKDQVAARIGDRHLLIDLGTPRSRAGTVTALNASRLHDLILQPFLGINEPRTDTRVEYVESDADYTRPEYDAWFLPHPEAIEDVLTIADHGQVMPPKSTLFGPKLPSGMVIRTIEPM